MRMAIDEIKGTAQIDGFDMPDAKVAKRTRDVIVLKVPGHKVWVQLPPDSHIYAPTEFKVYRVLEQLDYYSPIEGLRVELIVEFPIR